MNFSSDPHSEAIVSYLAFRYRLQQLIHEVQSQMAVLQQRPASLKCDPRRMLQDQRNFIKKVLN